MLVDRKAAGRYARALLRLAEQSGTVPAVQEDLDLVAGILTREPQVAQALDHPVLAPEQKKALVRQALAGHLQPATLDYLELLIDKQRTSLLPAIREEFRRACEDLTGVIPATVTSAAPLAPEELESLQRLLQQLFRAQPVITVSVDPGLIGGVRTQVRNTVIDGTVRGTLEQMRDHLERRGGQVLRRGTMVDE